MIKDKWDTFLVAEELEIVSNEVLKRLIDRLRRSDEEELRLRLRME